MIQASARDRATPGLSNAVWIGIWLAPILATHVAARTSSPEEGVRNRRRVAGCQLQRRKRRGVRLFGTERSRENDDAAHRSGARASERRGWGYLWQKGLVFERAAIKRVFFRAPPGFTYTGHTCPPVFFSSRS